MSKLLECHQQRWTNFAYSKTFPAFPARCLDSQQILSMCYKLRSNSSHDCRKIRRVSIRMLTTSSPRTFRPSRTCRPAFSLSARTSSSSITANSKVKGPSLLSLSHPVSVGRETEHFLVKFLCSKQASGLYTWSFILRDEPNQEFHRCSWNKCCQGILMSSFLFQKPLFQELQRQLSLKIDDASQILKNAPHRLLDAIVDSTFKFTAQALLPSEVF